MTTIKAYTDLSQSKVLAEILPLESADMHYNVVGDAIIGDYQSGISSAMSVAKAYKKNPDEFAKNVIPCWSLAALLDVIPEGVIENYYAPNIQKENGKYHIAYGNEELLCEADNPVDACYEMIIKLNELKNK